MQQNIIQSLLNVNRKGGDEDRAPKVCSSRRRAHGCLLNLPDFPQQKQFHTLTVPSLRYISKAEGGVLLVSDDVTDEVVLPKPAGRDHLRKYARQCLVCPS